MSFRQVFNEKMEEAIRITVDSPVSDVNYYSQILAQTYFFVCHSTRLLTLSAARMPFEMRNIHNRLIAHADEESGHENLALADLHRLGYSIDQFKELTSTKAFYQSQYYWIDYEGPISFFGYIMMLEGIAIKAGPIFYEKALEAGFKKGSSFVRVHCEEDEDHVEKAMQVIDSLSPEHQKLVTENFIQSYNMYMGIRSECENVAKNLKLPKAG